MKKLFLITFTLTSILLNGQDFRNANWGMTYSQVKSSESAKLVKESSDLLAYQTTLADFDAFVLYIFAGGKLTRTQYKIIETHTNKNDYISDYNTLKELLQKKYGNTTGDEKIWKNELYKDDLSEWGFAVSLGHLVYYATWKTAKTDVILSLSGENYEIETVIEYSSTELGKLEDNLRSQDDLNKFSQFGFRFSSWGDSKASVKAKEKLEIVDESSSLLAYKTTIGMIDLLIGYLFTNDKLTTGRYLVTETHTNKNDYITDYNTLKKILDQKYGTPKKDEKYWKNDLYKDDYSEWGFAVSLGHLIYYATYENEKSEITIMLNGENYEIQLMIEATSKEFKDLEKKAKEVKVLNDF